MANPPAPINGKPHHLTWEAKPGLYINNPKGVALPIYANAVMMLRTEGKFWGLRYDTFSEQHFLDNDPITDQDLRKILEWMHHRGITVTKNICDEAVFRVADDHPFHQVVDWLETLEWDGISRLDMLLIDHANAPETALNKAITAKWFIQAAARVYEPGCQADATLILEGPQDQGKSSLFRAAFGDKWFTDQLPNLSDKDASIQIQGVWCVEISELAALRKAEVGHVKQFLTRRVDRFRTPYGKIATGHPRQTVFAGTVNPGAQGYLRDETGNRRFWPIETSGDINSQAIYDNREQIWAEAVHRYKSGEPWHLNNRALVVDVRAVQADRYASDPWLELIERFVATRSQTDVSEIFTECLQIHSLADRDQHSQNRIAGCLSHLGWTRKRSGSVDPKTGKRPWRYLPPIQPVPDQWDIDFQQADSDLHVPVETVGTDQL